MSIDHLPKLFHWHGDDGVRCGFSQLDIHLLRNRIQHFPGFRRRPVFQLQVEYIRENERSLNFQQLCSKRQKVKNALVDINRAHPHVFAYFIAGSMIRCHTNVPSSIGGIAIFGIRIFGDRDSWRSITAAHCGIKLKRFKARLNTEDQKSTEFGPSAKAEHQKLTNKGLSEAAAYSMHRDSELETRVGSRKSVERLRPCIFPPVVQNFAEGAEWCGRASRKRGNFRLRFEVRPDRKEIYLTAFPENIYEI